MTMLPKKQGIARLIAATRHSADGLAAAWRGEAAFRQETWLALVLLPNAYWLGTTWLERAVLIAVVGLVLIVELLNTAVEVVVDRISVEQHPLSGRAKDVASAAVMLSLVLCAAVWGMALWQRWPFV